MRVLFAISIFSFCALAWAALAIARHIRRTNSTTRTTAQQPLALAVSPSLSAASTPDPTLLPGATRRLRPQTAQRHDRTFASSDSGNLLDPGARAQTRPGRQP